MELILSELRGERALFGFERWKRTPGLYSDPLVQVSGSGLTAGTLVEVPSS